MKPEEVVLDKVEIVCKADSDDCGESKDNKTAGSNDEEKAEFSKTMSYVGATATGLDEAIKELKSNKGLATAVGTAARYMGNVSNTLSVFEAIASDNPSYEVPKAFVKIWTGMKGASVGIMAVNKIPYKIPLLYPIGAVLGAYLGPQGVELFMDQSKDILSKLSQKGISDAANEARERYEAEKALKKCLFDFEKNNKLTPLPDDKFGRKMLIDLINHANGQNGSFTPEFNSDNQGAKTAAEQAEAIGNVLEAAKQLNANIKQVVIDKQTYDVKKLSGSQLANVLSDIPKVSFLLSNILIFEGEKLSLGDKGTYTVKKGDTVSQIAQKYGLSTKELVILNPYLAKEDRIKFEQDSVLVKADKSKIEDDDSSITVSASSASAAEAARKMTFLITVSRPLKKGEYVTVSVNGQEIHFKEGKQSEEYKYTWEDDKIPEEDSEFKITPTVTAHSDGLNVTTASGTGTIIDDDKDPDDDDPENPTIPSDPLAIDLNRDGTRTLKLNGALNFDIDGNGFKEATGWISPEDAFWPMTETETAS